MNKNKPTKTIEYDAFLNYFKDFIEDMSKGISS